MCDKYFEESKMRQMELRVIPDVAVRRPLCRGAFALNAKKSPASLLSGGCCTQKQQHG